ncbi:rhodanese-like domain-containing protein [Gluconobacter kanchanaburiensis]|uniref:Thiosulfate sulfurtransferase n=1 Tax=Gluconobacter kanchanaburiensis NBRC 103587 TaxID=1307948 RepID=A0A511B4N6_9PROT|nr:rhodanese-like domain-containing protein [Gluconobacter kanchanaburiensis]MBF0861760.1 rhodanese-related sulfurtransferase [Gluconobacter kanchanaburiensis]GBR67387.1 rhodanese-related sulfurtransferase [Gluconobacter kanchanaburiensis NBRC 103587]GEK95410.1 thiosulfate sulfurtransferase [Gluconobacter kanchanaburiensis NBRC 103587]
MNSITSLQPLTTSEDVRAQLRNGVEIALLDVREEDPFASAHPLFAVNLPLGRIEERVAALVPRLDVPVVVYDNGEGRTAQAIRLLRTLGYTDVSALAGGLEGWRRSGGEIFIDVNVPSKAFGELVEHVRHTPSLPARELHERIERGDDLVILDARRFIEYNVMSIPGGRSVPGGELALRVRDIAPSPATTVVVNCAGRTRSIIGTQSLINAGIPNPVYALRNGTIGWTLEGLSLEHGADRKGADISAPNLEAARSRAEHLAGKAGVRYVDAVTLGQFLSHRRRTVYRLDVRSPEEYVEGHLAGFRSAPGGQLVQATDEWIGVRHGTVVLTDDDGVRARMTAHWLRQLGWNEVYVLTSWSGLPIETGQEAPQLARPLPVVETISVEKLAALTPDRQIAILDLASSPVFRKGHIVGACFVIRSDLASQPAIQTAKEIILVSPDGIAAHLAAPDLAGTGARVRVLKGGTDAWKAAGYPVETGLDEATALSVPNDVYKRPYEGTDNAAEAMQAYLDWEFGLIAQLEKDGTHGFRVLEKV